MQNAIARALSKIGREATRIVLPAWCVACARELPWSGRVASCCSECWASLPKIEGPRCRSCALPIAGEDDLLCIACTRDPLPVAWADAVCYYRGSIERVLHAFKFERHDFFDAPLAALLHERLLNRGDLAFDAIVPVPMTRARERRRGYNQAELLGRELSKASGIACKAELLTRREAKATQSTLPRAERRSNVRKAFVAAAACEEKSILLVDDITTTGETLRACAGEILRKGASRVCAITVAKAD